jgi:hypothetical protein
MSNYSCYCNFCYGSDQEDEDFTALLTLDDPQEEEIIEEIEEEVEEVEEVDEDSVEEDLPSEDDPAEEAPLSLETLCTEAYRNIYIKYMNFLLFDEVDDN